MKMVKLKQLKIERTNEVVQKRWELCLSDEDGNCTLKIYALIDDSKHCNRLCLVQVLQQKVIRVLFRVAKQIKKLI